jgi:serine/threonine-protein phosphatase 4 regulatory subunit 1
LTEAAVRIEVMEQIPHVAVLCVEHRGLNLAIPQYILPVVVRYLTDPNNQVIDTYKILNRKSFTLFFLCKI